MPYKDPTKERERSRRKYLRTKADPEKYEHRKALNALWMKKNYANRGYVKAKTKEEGKIRKIENPESIKRYNKKYYEKTRDRYKHRSQQRRALLKSGIGNHTLSQWLDKCCFYGWRCFYCHCVLSQETVTKDHFIPLSRGGTDFASNLVPACLTCNLQKNLKRWKRGHKVTPLPVRG